jgi:hypothetical protein
MTPQDKDKDEYKAAWDGKEAPDDGVPATESKGEFLDAWHEDQK